MIPSVSILLFLLANIVLAAVLNKFGINIFSRTITKWELYFSIAVIFLVPNTGLLWILLDLTSAGVLSEFRNFLRPTLLIGAMWSVVACHAVAVYINRSRHGADRTG